MKKGIVLERHSDYTIIMTKDGSFEKVTVPGENADVGEEVSYKPWKTEKKTVAMLFPWKEMNMPIRALSMACIVLLLAFPIYFLAGESKTYAYVTVDINPSIEMEVDKDFNVQHIRAINEDASILLEDIPDYEDEYIEKVIEMILAETEQKGFINDERNMIVGISYAEENPEGTAPLPGKLDSYFSNVSGWEIATLVVPNNIRKQAVDKEISMNEEMASKILDEDKNSSMENSLDSTDKAIIDSFYNEKSDVEEDKSSEFNRDTRVTPPVVNDTGEKAQDRPNIGNFSDSSDKGNSKTDAHPSVLKEKNGEMNSNGNSSENSMKKEKQTEQKPSTPNNSNGKEQKIADNEKSKEQPKEKKKKSDNGNKNEHKQNNGNGTDKKDKGNSKDKNSNNKGNNQNHGNGNNQNRGNNHGNGNK
ncbi:anti-sigma-I factor RsgI family protein [Oceanobacillus damuensis]|uniref:anti-sigma-I factor RsgI family protein n=1 Tax=Oceanobacillus damuensis TaxID=937928 RepID=UPI000830D97B|nr:anti-sigma factor domain-containing protein [Oceanobacillus damuensis]